MANPQVEIEGLGEILAQMHASFDGVAMSGKKDGYIVKFFVDLEEADQIPALNAAIQRLIVLTVRRYSPRSASSSTPLTLIPFVAYPEAWRGS